MNKYDKHIDYIRDNIHTKSVIEIANHLGVSVSAMRSALTRIRRSEPDNNSRLYKKKPVAPGKKKVRTDGNRGRRPKKVKVFETRIDTSPKIQFRIPELRMIVYVSPDADLVAVRNKYIRNKMSL